MNKICIIGVYFGEFPKYFPLWLKSAEYNSTIDFYIYTDQKLLGLPDNVHVKYLTINQMKYLADCKLGLNTCLNKPYKCCDFKPVYGLIFEDDIKQYDYWGHCDFDLIFGDLQYFFDKYDLYSYDRFLALGHLSLYRNTPEVLERYKSDGAASDYIDTFTKEPITVFDEIRGMTSIYLKNGYPIFTKRIFIDIATVYHRYRMIDEYSLDVPAVNSPNQTFVWEKGKVYREYEQNGEILKEEYIYIHFQKRPNYPCPENYRMWNAFYITNQGFFEKDGDSSLEIIKKMNPFKGNVYEFSEKIRFNINRLFIRGRRKIKSIFKIDKKR